MLTVTETAKEKLREALQAKIREAEMTFRIMITSAAPKRFEIGLDTEREGDQVVENDEGVKVLLIGANLAEELEGMVFDYREVPQGARFTISKPSPDT